MGFFITLAILAGAYWLLRFVLGFVCLMSGMSSCDPRERELRELAEEEPQEVEVEPREVEERPRTPRPRTPSKRYPQTEWNTGD